ncbi:MAG: indolepyruvate ferredoxin oxidoreductase [Gammaproteobacteria bacterium]|jgi:indolepyruvate ferredoxin oxidoreductase
MSVTDPIAPAAVAPHKVALDDKYTLREGRVFMTGIQALVRLPLEQRWRDSAAGLRTAGYISGYRGSPLGAYDQQLQRAQTFLNEQEVKFNPGVNEDLAATACWGTQQAGVAGEGTHDGVFALWYGKGPGVDRSGDAFRHGNLAGTSRHGGVVCLIGDDHTCESSTTAHHSEYAMVDASIPVLNPAGVQEILDYGLYAIALSRFSGAWTALKCVHDTVEAAASVDVDGSRVKFVEPSDYTAPEGGLHIRFPDPWLEQEKRLYEDKLDAVRAFARANQFDKTVFGSANARIGIITTGKSYLDTCQALDELDIDEAAAERLGIAVYKVAMPFPLEPEGVKAFCQGRELIIVVEEKRALIETQLKDMLYGQAGAPRIVGKRDENGALMFRASGRLDTNHIATVFGRYILEHCEDAYIASRTQEIQALLQREVTAAAELQRTPYFCPGCPHSSSTRVPEGSHALAGIGCHYLSQFMDRATERYTQMGGEGASWIGEAPFSKRKHMFQNIGDGTYFHSGLLAIRAAITSKVNITFKILYNDAVAMTGGQSLEGTMTVPRITQQMHAEGAQRVVVVTDEPQKYAADTQFAPGVSVYHRDELDKVQRELREIEGTTILVYDQTCAAEKRRRRKRGTFPDPAKRVFINEAVCEGCGDCGEKSNCLAVVPLETDLGRKRAVDQSACNKDFSCLKGFCPSFVTVLGGRPRRGKASAADAVDADELTRVAVALPEPIRPALNRPYGIVVTGVGGTGVVTIGALIGMAAHLDGKGCSILDQMGLAQKGGSVISHLRIAGTQRDITATRIAAGGADLVLGGDLLTTGATDTLTTMASGRTRVVANVHEIMPGAFTRGADIEFPGARIQRAIRSATGEGGAQFLNATRLATALMGDAIASNLFLLGYAYQKGLLPVSGESLLQAIELNGVAIDMNKQAFTWGRHAALDMDAVRAKAFPQGAPSEVGKRSLDETIAHRSGYLSSYQNTAYAQRYENLVAKVRRIEVDKTQGLTGLGEAVAKNYFKLLAYKDEYEVGRLFSDSAFTERLQQAFEGDYQIEFHLAPPLFAKIDPNSGQPKKRAYGQWMMKAFKCLAALKGLRGTWLDVFGYTAERRMERELIVEYEVLLDTLLDQITPSNHASALALASLPEKIRGFGHVKLASVEQAREQKSQLLDAFNNPIAPAVAA